MTDFDLQMALSRLAETMLPDDELQQRKANAAVISPDGGVNRRPLIRSLPWFRIDVPLPGEAVAMSNAARIAFPQGGVIRHVSISAQTAPGGNYSIHLVAPTDSQSFSLQAGISSRMLPADIDVEANSWVSVNVINAGGAEDVFISIHYTPLGGS